MAPRRKEYELRCAGCHARGAGVDVRTGDEPALDLGWVVLPPGWMVGSTRDDWQDDLVCSESCILTVTSRRRGVEVAAEMATLAKSKQAWTIVTSARARDQVMFCDHCRERPMDEAVSDHRNAWCSTECKTCSGQACPHFDAHRWRIQDEHTRLCDEVDRLRHENTTLRREIGAPESDREMETVAAEIQALDGRATKAPWGEKCGMLKHYAFSKEPGEDFGVSLQEMHPEDGRIVPAHDNANLIAFYRNYAPALARSWSALWRRMLRVGPLLSDGRGALRAAEETLSVLGRMAHAKERLDLGPDSLAFLDRVLERVRAAIKDLDVAHGESLT